MPRLPRDEDPDQQQIHQVEQRPCGEGRGIEPEDLEVVHLQGIARSNAQNPAKTRSAGCGLARLYEQENLLFKNTRGRLCQIVKTSAARQNYRGAVDGVVRDRKQRLISAIQ